MKIDVGAWHRIMRVIKMWAVEGGMRKDDLLFIGGEAVEAEVRANAHSEGEAQQARSPCRSMHLGVVLAGPSDSGRTGRGSRVEA